MKHFIREGKDINSKHDLYDYLESRLQVGDKKTLIEKLSKHPYYLNVPLNDIGKTLEYLIKCGFHTSSIYEVLWIMLYPM